jgi:hypothetical protein
MARAFSVFLLLVATACATAGNNQGDDDDDDDIDAPSAGTPDAPVGPGTPDAPVGPGTPDARPPVDASIPTFPDAGIPTFPDAGIPTFPDAGGGAFCTSDSMCGPGECCLTLGGPMGFCVAGMTIPGIGCIPDM